jgi:hypothetical protein
MKLKTQNRTSLFLLGVVLALLAAPAGFAPRSESTGLAQAQAGYTLASQVGTYAYTCSSIAAGAAKAMAGFGTFTSDGNGNMTGTTYFANVPSPDGSRRIVPWINGVATYTINADGTGTATWTMTNPDGVTGISHYDRVITQAEVIGGVKVATEIVALQREPVMNAGALLTCVAKRLPDAGVFTNTSVQGTYALTINTGPNMVSCQGIATMDGNGNASGPFITNAPTTDGGRQVVPGTFAVSYTLNPDGTAIALGTTTTPAGTGQFTNDLLITQAKVVGGVKVATEVFGMQREAKGGLFSTYLFKRLPD